MEGGRLALTGRVISHDGGKMLEVAFSESWHAEGAVGSAAAHALGCRVAESLLAQGAAELIQVARQVPVPNRNSRGQTAARPSRMIHKRSKMSVILRLHLTNAELHIGTHILKLNVWVTSRHSRVPSGIGAV